MTTFDSSLLNLNPTMNNINALPYIQAIAQTSTLDQSVMMSNLEREFALAPYGDFPCDTYKCSQLSGVLTLGKRKLATYSVTENRIYFSPEVEYADRDEKLADIRTQIIGASIMRQAIAEINAFKNLDATNTGVRSCGRAFVGHARQTVDFNNVRGISPTLISELIKLYLGELPAGIEVTPFLKQIILSVYMNLLGADRLDKGTDEERIEIVKNIDANVPVKFLYYLVFGSEALYWNLCMPHQASDMSSYSPEYQEQISNHVTAIVTFLSKWNYVSVIQDPKLKNDAYFVQMPVIEGVVSDLGEYVENLYSYANGKTDISMKATYALVEGLLEPDLAFGHTTKHYVTEGESTLEECISYGDFLFDAPLIIHIVDPGQQNLVFKSNRMFFNSGCSNMGHIWKNASNGSNEPMPSLIY